MQVNDSDQTRRRSRRVVTAHPVYSPRDLADLVAKHDREHPDHAEDCGCQNGLVAALRIYFAPKRPVVSDGPRTYVPPDLIALRDSEPPDTSELIKRKPWLRRRDGETEPEYDYRTSRSCFNCGLFVVDGAALNEHEDQCSLRGRRNVD